MGRGHRGCQRCMGTCGHHRDMAVMDMWGHGDMEMGHTGVMGTWGHRDTWASQGCGDGGHGAHGDRDGRRDTRTWAWGQRGHVGTNATFPQEVIEQGHHVGVDDRLCCVPCPHHDARRVPKKL